MSVENLLLRARILADTGRYDAADRLLALALAEEPDNEDGLSLLTRGLVARKRYEEAAAAGERLLAAYPDSVRGLLAMARIPNLLGRPRHGVPYARRAVEVAPDNATCLVTLAQVLNWVTPGSSEALALIDNATAIDPYDAAAPQVAAEICLDVAQYAQAETWALRALRIEPDNCWTVLQLGVARAGLGRFDESREQVISALRTNPEPGVVRQMIAYVEFMGIPDHVADVYRLALVAAGQPDVSDPAAAGDDPELIAAQGRLVYQMYSAHAGPAGQPRVRELADAVLAADPRNPHARYVRSRLLSDAEQYADALTLAQRLHEEGYPQADEALVVAQAGLGEYAAALATAERGARQRPESALWLRAQAQCLRHLHRYDEAVRAAQRAAKLSASAPQVQLQLGLAARAAGDPALAEHAFRQAGTDAPGDGEAVAYLALLLAETGRWPEAEPLMATLSRTMPDVRRLIHPCMSLAAACAEAALPSLEQVDIDNPDPVPLDAAAHWLDLFLDMCAVAMGGYRDGETELPATLAPRLAALHQVTAPQDGHFARTVRRFDLLMADWTSR